jgi:hypothetical protein
MGKRMEDLRILWRLDGLATLLGPVIRMCRLVMEEWQTEKTTARAVVDEGGMSLLPML